MASRATIQLRPHHGVIDIDGQDISHVVRAIHISHAADEDHPTVLVELVITDLLKAEADVPSVSVGPDTRAALVALGWTPPDTEDEVTKAEAADQADKDARGKKGRKDG